ncbi:SpoIID/LytB domain-containing protein [Nocardia sp. CY41]|uniref:SpoIID/LytB domain-containing protein n=1 Tax=Nocardia sp. CY41 TaxID=2608686 RepID=UPI0022A70F02|nr:SpoIID/LytB domain-containing protein [Nocardia sp. CY41]
MLIGVGLIVGSLFAVSGRPIDAYRPLAGPGHGRGMSQLGAFDQARAGWGAERILAHYYPGATLGAIAPTAVRVRLMARDDSALDVFAAAGLRVAGREVAPGQVAHLTALPGGGANVVVTVGCDGAVLWQAATDDPWIRPADPRPDRPAPEHLTLCGGPAYRGALGVALEDGAARVVNQVDVEDYLRGVVPAEVQPNWADKGAAEALRAQAIAARSYALAEQRYPYAQTCDTTACQRYPGTAQEDQRTAAAVAATTGAVLLREGRILRTEYSAAPGGAEPIDIHTLDVGPAPEELVTTAPAEDPRTQVAVTPGSPVDPRAQVAVTPGSPVDPRAQVAVTPGSPVDPRAQVAVTPGAPVDPRAQTVVTESAVDAEYRRIGGAASSIGTPLGPEMILPQRAGRYRMYTNGVIVVTPTLGAQVVDYSRMLQEVPEPAGSQAVSPSAAPGVAAPSNAAAPTGIVAPEVGGVPTTDQAGTLGGASSSGTGASGGVIAPGSATRLGAAATGGVSTPAGTSSPGAGAPGGVIAPGVAGPGGATRPGAAATDGVSAPGVAGAPGAGAPGSVAAPAGMSASRDATRPGRAAAAR